MNQENPRQEIDIRNVDASLTYGKVYTSKILNILVLILIISAIFLILLATHGLVTTEDFAEDSTIIITAYVVSGIIILADILLYWCFSYARKKAEVFLQDSVFLKAKAISLGTKMEFRLPFPVEAIRVQFRYNGKSMHKDSMYKGSTRYLPVFVKYTDRTINIAYSPKYDEVLILKDDDRLKGT